MTLSLLFFYFSNSLLTEFHSTVPIAFFLFCPSLLSPYCWVHFFLPLLYTGIPEVLVPTLCSLQLFTITSLPTTSHIYWVIDSHSHWVLASIWSQKQSSNCIFHKDTLPNFNLYIFIFIQFYSISYYMWWQKAIILVFRMYFPIFWQSCLIFLRRRSSIPHSQSCVSHLPQPCEPTLMN